MSRSGQMQHHGSAQARHMPQKDHDFVGGLSSSTLPYKLIN